jgi:hypothetical protein
MLVLLDSRWTKKWLMRLAFLVNSDCHENVQVYQLFLLMNNGNLASNEYQQYINCLAALLGAAPRESLSQTAKSCTDSGTEQTRITFMLGAKKPCSSLLFIQSPPESILACSLT